MILTRETSVGPITINLNDYESGHVEEILTRVIRVPRFRFFPWFFYKFEPRQFKLSFDLVKVEDCATLDNIFLGEVS